MWSFKPRIKTNSKSNKNKQSVKGDIQMGNTTIQAPSTDASLAMIMAELLKINSRLNHIEVRSDKIHKAFNLYVQNNGVKPEIKQRVKDILDQ